MNGRYEGKLTLTWLPDGRLMELADAFAFIDAETLRWDVPPGAQIDGASIPQFLWAVTGSPYTGKYRDASVVHDWYCCMRSRTADSTHRMFYEAMLVSGVSPSRATLMYAAVKYAGPRWTAMDIHNANLAAARRWAAPQRYDEAAGGTAAASGTEPGGGGGFGGGGRGDYEPFDPVDPRVDLAPARAPADVSEDEFKGLAEQILDGTIDLQAIDAQFRADVGRSEDLPGGLFPFRGDSPL